ncbi:MAG: dienelactone hydrolase family protein [Myxococcota bacterium]
MTIDARLVALYDEYCHSDMSRRQFMARASALTLAGGVSACAAAEQMLPDYSRVTVNFNDPRIRPDYVSWKSPGGNGGTMRGYLVAPATEGPFGAVLVVHENRGLNPYIEDVARRVALAGYLALAPDALTSVGGYPGNDDEGKALQRSLDREKIKVDMTQAARFLRGHALSRGRLGVTGFCFGGGISNYLAATLGDELAAAAPFYGSAPDLGGVREIRAELVLHYAEKDPRVNASRGPYEAALTAAGVKFASYTYPGTGHGFHNDSTPRFVAEQAERAWARTLDLFTRTLGSPHPA